MAVDYKQKWMELRSKMLESTDVAYRLGYEEGLKAGEQQAMEQQMQQQQEEDMMRQGIDPETGQPMEVPPEEGGIPQEEMGGQQEMPPEEMGEEEGSELDDHINQLESLVSKGEKPSVVSMRKAVENISNLRKSQKEKFHKKTQKMDSLQRNTVKGILKKWESESKDLGSDLEKIIKEDGIQLDD